MNKRTSLGKSDRLSSAKQLGDHNPLFSARSQASSIQEGEEDGIVRECSQPQKRSFNHFFVYKTNRPGPEEIPAKVFTKLPIEEGIRIKP